MVYNFLSKVSRRKKRAILFTMDLSLIIVSLYSAFALRLSTVTPISPGDASWLLFPLLALFGGGLIAYLGLPSIKLNAFENYAVRRVGICAAGLVTFAAAFSYVLELEDPRSVPLIFGVVFFFTSVITKLLANALLKVLEALNTAAMPVAIYGAGAAGIQLASALRRSKEVRPIVFVDDNPSLQGLLIAGLKVEHPKLLTKLEQKGRIKRVLIAIPSASVDRRKHLVQKLRDLSLDVQVLPSFVEMLAEPALSSELRVVLPDELLGRDRVDLDTPEIAKTYAGRSVMVTGAGGSIGSELCRQLLQCRPRQIVFFERSELALYSIDQELRPIAAQFGIDIVTRLGSVTDDRRVRAVLKEAGVEIVLHAAAYKHVPLVEENELEGARNNVMGTRIVADAASDFGVERFILISTDKAVRPTNIMGATKRMAELVLQDLQSRSKGTQFSMVRFGNVLGSSGSVLPRFQAQISSGGPVTVTHPDITRYFMTIPEAARLVLLAGTYSAGGDVFLLDMGQPMKIIDIARRMITLSGYRERKPGSLDGDIEIKITGLRPGEKLYEELLIDSDNLGATPHKKILRAKEAGLSQIEVAAMMKELGAALDNGDTAALRRLVEERVDGYHREKDVA